MRSVNSSTRSNRVDQFCLIEIADQVAAVIDGGAMIGVAAEANVVSDSSIAWTITRSSSTSSPAGESISGIGFAGTSGANLSFSKDIVGISVGVGNQEIEQLQSRFFRARFGGRQGIHHRYRLG